MLLKVGFSIAQNCTILGYFRYMPNSNALLSHKNITIISARSQYSEEFPGDYGRWKI